MGLPLNKSAEAQEAMAQCVQHISVLAYEQKLIKPFWGTQAMNQKLNTYGISIVERPKIKATKKLDLGGEQGKQIVYSETKLALRTHKRTFQKLADM